MRIQGVRNKDIEKLEWFYNTYNNIDAVSALTYKMSLCSFNETVRLDNYLKAIRQDIRKIFSAIQNIDEIYDKYKNKEDYNFPVQETETVAIFIEYIFSKYRVIIEYTLKILDMIVDFEGVLGEENGKRLKDYEIYNKKLDYLNNLVSDSSYKNILNLKWFQHIRKTRNSIIHAGATCLVFGDNKKKLFQIYDLEGKELINENFYLKKEDCIYFDYFMAINIANLFLFIDSIFSIILEKQEYIYDLDGRIEEKMLQKAMLPKQDYIMKWIKDIIVNYKMTLQA